MEVIFVFICRHLQNNKTAMSHIGAVKAANSFLVLNKRLDPRALESVKMKDDLPPERMRGSKRGISIFLHKNFI